MLASILRKGLSGTAALAILAGASGFVTANAADPGQDSFLSKPLRWLKSRSAEKRFEELQATEPAPNPQSDTIDPINPEPAELLPGDQSPLRYALGGADLPGAGSAPRVARVSLQQAGTPRELKPVTSILPYADYQPETTQIDQQVSPDLVAPEEVSIDSPGEPRSTGEPILYQWQASNLYHYPLYFEDPSLERYGHTHENYLQPVVSVARFGVQLVGLPYQMTIDPVWKRRYTLGWYRPGECAPKQYEQIPWNTKAAINQAAVTTGLWFAFP
jgi:hypothetical protein